MPWTHRRLSLGSGLTRRGSYDEFSFVCLFFNEIFKLRSYDCKIDYT